MLEKQNYIKIGQIFKIILNKDLCGFVTPIVIGTKVALCSLPYFDEKWKDHHQELYENITGIWNINKAVNWQQSEKPTDPSWNCITEEQFCQIIGDLWDRENFIPITLEEYKQLM